MLWSLRIVYFAMGAALHRYATAEKVLIWVNSKQAVLLSVPDQGYLGVSRYPWSVL